MGRKLAMPLLGILLWVLSIHCGTFANASFLNFHPSSVEPLDFSGFREKVISDPKNRGVILKVSSKDLNDSVSYGDCLVNRMTRLESSLGWSNIHVKHGTPAHGQFIENEANIEALEQGRAGLVSARASQHLMHTRCQRFTVNKQQCAKMLTTFKMSSTPLQSVCSLISKTCSPAETTTPYRSIDGSCNHLSSDKEATRGRAFTAYKRLLFPLFLDGIMEPRRAVDKTPLPSARLVSTSLTKHMDQLDSRLTLALMQWTQFVAHDMTHTASSKMISSKNSIVCCDENGYNLSPRYVHPLCLQITIPSDDAFYSKYRINCMSYVRSLPAIRSDCTFGPIEQMNQATHFLDGSHIYGSTVSKANSLRQFIGGRLLTSTNSGRHFLPMVSNAKDSCQVDNETGGCYRAGDSRVNMHPHLTVMHTFWIREHNRVAKALESLNPKWNDETLYQEARKIVIAQIQHITYTKWLPIVIGKSNSQKVLLHSKFNENVDPSVSNSFATVAVRFLNSLMDSHLKLYKEDRMTNASLRLQDHFNKPVIIEQSGNLDALVRGLATQRSQMMDMEFVPDITQQLYRSDEYGLDALSLDIQRGRDHGLPPYVDYRKLCGLKEVKDFDDLLDYIPAQAIEMFRSVYKSPQDIDLLVGALAEKPVLGQAQLLGPTLTCLISEQMYRTRLGDRFFYTHRHAGTFTEEQLKEIKKASLARIFCDNSDDIAMMQPDVFSVISDRNSLVNCDDDAVIERINLLAWKE